MILIKIMCMILMCYKCKCRFHVRSTYCRDPSHTNGLPCMNITTFLIVTTINITTITTINITITLMFKESINL